MLHDLLHRPLDEHALRHPLSTSGKREVTTHSLKPIQRWWFEHLKAGYILRTKLEDGQFRAEWPEKILKSALHSDLLQFLGDHNPGRQRSTQTELGIFLKRFAPVEHRRFLVNDKQQWVWVLPPLEECRARWLKACGWADDYNWNND
jgi:hypothetical protein